MAKVLVFDLGGTLMEYKGMPDSWVDYYKQGFESINSYYHCGVSTACINKSIEILKSFNPRCIYREIEYTPEHIFSKALEHWSVKIPIQIRIEDDVMFISNCSMLPFGWTAETLLSSHTSKPYNPDIARVFYRAGYIESWGRGIQKICDACKNLGTEEPEYIVHGEDIMVKFMALQSANASVPKNPKPQNPKRQNDALNDALENKLMMLLKDNPYLKQNELAGKLSVSRATVQRLIKKIVDENKIERKGGKRYGYWEIHEK